MSAPFDNGGTSPVENTGSTGDSVNPAWQGVYDVVPEDHRESVRTALSDFDNRYNDLNTRYKAYEVYGSPQEIQKYQAIYQSLDTDPVAFYNRIGQALREQGRLANDPQSQQNNFDPNAQPDPEAERLRNMEQEMLNFKAFREEQQRVMAESQAAERLTQGMSALKEFHSRSGRKNEPFSEPQIYRAAAIIQQQQPQLDVVSLLQQAYNVYCSDMDQFATMFRPRADAPNVINPSSGGMPPAVLGGDYKTPEGRRAMINKLISGNQ